ncbi:MAG: SLC13 family permease [Anaerolineaceae bacterium]|nr:SLC13 family permease [Anaerolineaceae bacterium]
MTLPIALLLGIIALAIILFSIEYFPVDVVALTVLIAVILTGLLPPETAFAGFGSNTSMMILGILIMTAGLSKTGVIEMTGQALLKHSTGKPEQLFTIIMIAAAVMSAFLSNTAATAFFMPITISLARRTKTNPSRLLMPLAFAAILASSITLVSSSTNIVISGLITQYDLPPLGMFELTLVGLPVLLLGLGYMLLIGRRLVPERATAKQVYDPNGTQPYITEVVPLPNSPLLGKTLEDSRLGQDFDIVVLKLSKANQGHLIPGASQTIEIGDSLLIEVPRDHLPSLHQAIGVQLKQEVKITKPATHSQGIQLFELILLPGSPLIGRTLATLNFRKRFGMQVLGINRSGETLQTRLGNLRLRVGDQLLVQGAHETIVQLGFDNRFRILDIIERKDGAFAKAPLAVGIFVTALLIAALEILSLPVAALLGAAVMFLSGCVTPEEAYREVNWPTLILIGSMLALGTAMQSTGAAAYFAEWVVDKFGSSDPRWLLTAFFALTMLLTQPMSNQAAAALVLPLAVQTALRMGLNPRSFAVMIAVGASCSFLTPLEPACLMIYGPGGYRFLDFFKNGLPLTLLTYLIAILLVPLFWPL